MRVRVVAIIFGVLLLLTGTIRILFSISNDLDDEMDLYVHNLNYVFNAKLDSIILSNNRGGGYLFFSKTNGVYNKFVEDSLNRHLVNYKRIRIFSFTPSDQIKLFIGDVNKYLKDDSLSVNSNNDRLEIFRDGKSILKSKVSKNGYYKVYFAFWLAD
jgi:hypothetical protein